MNGNAKHATVIGPFDKSTPSVIFAFVDRGILAISRTASQPFAAALVLPRTSMTATSVSRVGPPAEQAAAELPESRRGKDPGPIKILHIINDLGIGGAEMMLYRLLCHHSRERFDSAVLSLMDRGSLRARIEGLGIPVYTAGMKPGLPTPASIWRLLRIVRQIRPDLIRGWLYHGNLAAQLTGMAIGSKTPVLWSIHCSVFTLSFDKKLTTAVMRLSAPISRLATSISFDSQTSRAQHQKLGYSARNSCFIPNGIDTSIFVPSAAARVAVRAELGLPPEALLIGVIGRYHAMKDHATFLRAAGQITATYPNAQFLLAGREVDRENRALSDLIRELKLADRVHLLGERTDIARLVAALDVFALSSSHGESFPTIVGEAMSSGVPCVVTNVGDSAWMVKDSGRVVPPRDVAALASACGELINIGPEGRASLGRAARSRVQGLFSLASVVEKYEAMYESAVAPNTVATRNSKLAYQSFSGE